MEQLGYAQPSTAYAQMPTRFKSALPLLAYHRIFSDWYRDPRLQQSVFTEATMSEILDGSIHSNCPVASDIANSP